MNGSKYKVIVFDFDGVLVESVEVKDEAFFQLYSRLGKDLGHKALEYHKAHRGVSRYEKLKHLHQRYLGKDLNNAELEALAADYSTLVEQGVVEAAAVPGSQQFLKTYSGKIPMFVASATPQEELERIIQKRGLESFFTQIFGFPTKKSNAIREALRQTGASPGEALMIGDAQADWDAAKETGVDFIAREVGEGVSFPPHVLKMKDLTTLHEKLKQAQHG